MTDSGQDGELNSAPVLPESSAEPEPSIRVEPPADTDNPETQIGRLNDFLSSTPTEERMAECLEAFLYFMSYPYAVPNNTKERCCLRPWDPWPKLGDGRLGPVWFSHENVGWPAARGAADKLSYLGPEYTKVVRDIWPRIETRISEVGTRMLFCTTGLYDEMDDQHDISGACYACRDTKQGMKYPSLLDSHSPLDDYGEVWYVLGFSLPSLARALITQ